MAELKTNIEEVVKRIKKLSGNLVDMTDFYKMVGALEQSNTLLRFKDEKAPDGTAWRDPITLRRDPGGSQYSKDHAFNYWRKSNFNAIPKGWHYFSRGSDKVLTDTGVLRRSIQFAYGKDFAEVGTDIKYGKYVQNLGFEFIGVSSQTQNNVEKAFKFYMGRITK